MNRNIFVACRRFITISQSMRKRQPKQVQVSTAHQHSDPVSEQNGQVIIKIHAKPGAKYNSVTDISEEVGIQIAAPPVDGEANTELVKYLSKLFGLKKSQVLLDKGARSRNKTVVVSGASREHIVTQLKSAIEQT